MEKKGALEFQLAVREEEAEKRAMGIDYSKQHVRQAMVHSREDLVIIFHAVEETKLLSRRMVRLQTLISILLVVIVIVLLFK